MVYQIIKAFLLFIAVAVFALPLYGDFYVAPDGDDSNPGTQAEPFATLERARQEVRTVNSEMSSDIVVHLAAGDYPVSSAVVFDEADSGMNGHEVIYRASGEPGSVRLLGGQMVTNWQPYQGEIMMADLGLPAFDTLYENGRRVRKARFPNFVPDPDLPLARADYLRATGVDGSHRLLRYAAGAFDPSGWDLSDAQIHLWPGGKRAWFTGTIPITSLDPATRVIRLAEDSRYDIYQRGAGSRYYVQGVLDLLDEPGEFHYDSSAGRLYYWPVDGLAAEQEIVVPRVQRILSLAGSSESQRVHGLRFEGLSFEFTDFTDWFRHAHVSAGDSGEAHIYPQYDRQASLPQHRTGAVFLGNTEHITFDGCVVRNTGYSGFYSLGYNQNNSFQRCWISHVGIHGLFFEGLYPGEGDVQSHNTVDNCLIHDVGELVGHGAGVQLTNASNHLVTHCVIYNSPRYAVAMSAYVDIPIDDLYVYGNTVDHVRIQSCCQDSGDTAPIYAWGISDELPYLVNTFEQLLIDDTRAHPSMKDYPPNGVFLDNETYGQILTDIEVRNSQSVPYRTNGTGSQVLSNVSWEAGFDSSRIDYDSIGVRADHPFSVPPIRLAAQVIQDGVVLSWLPVANAATYTVAAAPAAEGPWSAVAPGLTEPSVTLADPYPEDLTFYRVTSSGPDGLESEPSLSVSVFRPESFSYGFEDCTGGDYSGSLRLDGNGNWVHVGNDNNKWVIDGDAHGLPAGYSGNFVYGNVGASDSQYTRKNDTNFSYSLNDSGTITFTFLARGRDTAGNQIIALGADANGNGRIDGGVEPGEIGFTFGVSVGNWHVREANFGISSNAAHGLGSGGNDSYELRLLVDPEANGGDGSGSFSYLNITAGDAWVEVAALQNINLRFSRMNAAVRSPSSWDGLYLRLGGNGCQVDSIVIDQYDPSFGPQLHAEGFDLEGAFRLAGTNLDPLETYILMRDSDLISFPEPIGDPVNGVNTATFLDVDPPTGKGFYRLVGEDETP